MPLLLHTGDLHINALRRFRSLYLTRIEDTLAEIYEVAKSRKVDFIVVAGDIFDRLDILHEERVLLSQWIVAAPVPIIAISGNHDKRTEEVGDTVLSYLSAFHFKDRHCIHDKLPRIVVYPQCTFILFPYNKWTDHEFYLLLDHTVPRAVTKAKGSPIIVVMHEAVSGCIFDNGMVMSRNDQIHLDAELLEKFEDITYWALGDMHSVQSIAPNVWYAGAPHQTKFGEKEGKGILIVNTNDPTNPEFVEIDSIPLINIQDTPEGFEFDKSVLYRFTPNHTVPQSFYIPDNVVIESKLIREGTENDAPLEPMVELFHGLDLALQRAGLKRDLIPLGIELAHKAANSLRIHTEVVFSSKTKNFSVGNNNDEG